ncbi:hypothetical protein J2Z40_002077 [Cytobacillus eiseniae]|uniref:Uncharacterized protein n=1 Tax=Cytobacillus eiseniae TaxID=762947 RepID=A0ABS4RGR3_9BACI|nr:hypothetical protein [Cytobacillus eiseniae]MBP2241514.1 hypothetical protein [Cytobacillus eiseniae]
MIGYFSFTVVIIGLIAALVITRKESITHNKLTKKGMYKLGIILAVVFFSVVTEVFLTPESWL